jgi:hypothetical protein
MNKSHDLNSILDAIENLNTKSKKKVIVSKIKHEVQIKKVFSPNEDLLPITEKIILEAENYSNNSKDKSVLPKPHLEDVLILDREYNEQNLAVTGLEEVKLKIIKDLDSVYSKNIEKNTLKIIFNLNEKIINLENKIKSLNISKSNHDNNLEENTNIIESEEHLINEDHLISEKDRKFFFNEVSSNLSETTINSLRLQDKLIKNFEKEEEKLRIKIVDLEQDISILNNKDN